MKWWHAIFIIQTLCLGGFIFSIIMVGRKEEPIEQIVSLLWALVFLNLSNTLDKDQS